MSAGQRGRGARRSPHNIAPLPASGEGAGAALVTAALEIDFIGKLTDSETESVFIGELKMF